MLVTLATCLLLPAAAVARGGVPRDVGVPVVTGSDVVGRTIQATVGKWSGAPTSYEVFWLRCDPTGERCRVINNAFGSSYTITAADVHHSLQAGVIATNGAGAGTAAYSLPTETVFSIPTTAFLLRGRHGAREFAYYLIERAGRRPRARDWARPDGVTVTPGRADIGVHAGETVYFSPTQAVHVSFGPGRTLEPGGVSGTRYRVRAHVRSRVRVRLPSVGRVYHPGLSHAERWVLGKLNRKRRARGEQPLRISRILDKAASVAARDEALHGRFPDPYLLTLPQSFGWPGDFAGAAVSIVDAPLRSRAQVLAHWDGSSAGESTGLWHTISDPTMRLVGIADGGGAWNLILVPGCPQALGPPAPCGATHITGL